MPCAPTQIAPLAVLNPQGQSRDADKAMTPMVKSERVAVGRVGGRRQSL
jgi:hypothetical protein